MVVGVTNVDNIFQLRSQVYPPGLSTNSVRMVQTLPCNPLWKTKLWSAALERIFCTSGDGGFVEQVGHLGSSVQVTVVARSSALAKRLQPAAGAVIFLPEIATRPEVAVALWPAY